MRILTVPVWRDDHLAEDLLEKGIGQPVELERRGVTAEAVDEVLLGTLVGEIQRQPIEAERTAAVKDRLLGRGLADELQRPPALALVGGARQARVEGKTVRARAQRLAHVVEAGAERVADR